MKNNNKIEKSTQTIDSGRSMVEMLGVLAVIGVLSIGGIYGYTYAMNKYQANQITNEVNLLVNQMYMMMLKEHGEEFDISLGNPYDSEEKLVYGDYSFYYGCGIDATISRMCLPNEVTYYAIVAKVPKKICQSLAQTTQHLPNLVEQRVNDIMDTTGTHCDDAEAGNEVTLFFELPNGDSKGDNNGCPQLKPVYNDVTGQCEACPSNTPQFNADTGQCEACPTGYEWNSSKNQCDNPNIKCAGNDECDPDEYCHVVAPANCRFSWQNCTMSEEISKSYCEKVSTQSLDNTGAVISVNNMTWYSARRFCDRLRTMNIVTEGVLVDHYMPYVNYITESTSIWINESTAQIKIDYDSSSLITMTISNGNEDTSKAVCK